MKKAILIALVIIATAMTANAQEKKNEPKVKHLTYSEFLKKVWDFERNPTTFEYEGKLPAVIDFYADWCGPCRRVAPIMEKMAEDYEGKLLVYKVNVSEEKDLAAVFQVRSIPMVLFIPVKGNPMKQVGALPESEYRETVEEFLIK
jgi:thioredoxin